MYHTRATELRKHNGHNVGGDLEAREIRVGTAAVVHLQF